LPESNGNAAGTPRRQRSKRAAASPSRAGGPGGSSAPEAELTQPRDDPNAIQILISEYGALQQVRSLVYNESFTRGGMFFAFLSTSLVALALVAQVLQLDRGFLLILIALLVFDLVIGVTTYGRIIWANYEDYLAVQAMARIRYAYAQVAPSTLAYLSRSIHDDLAGVMAAYGGPPMRGLRGVGYQLTTSATLVGLIDAMIAGVLGLAVALMLGASVDVAFIVGTVGGLAVFLAFALLTARFYLGVQRDLEVRFPSSRADIPEGRPPRS
jgi:hypothetical protein